MYIFALLYNVYEFDYKKSTTDFPECIFTIYVHSSVAKERGRQLKFNYHIIETGQRRYHYNREGKRGKKDGIFWRH